LIVDDIVIYRCSAGEIIVFPSDVQLLFADCVGLGDFKIKVRCEGILDEIISVKVDVAGDKHVDSGRGVRGVGRSAYSCRAVVVVEEHRGRTRIEEWEFYDGLSLLLN